MRLDKYCVANYVEQFLNSIFIEEIEVQVKSDVYIINGIYKSIIYNFWDKNDTELLDDFNGNQFCDDIIGTIFFFLSGYWEYIHQSNLDKYGRFKSVNSFLHKKSIIDEPVVDKLVYNLSNEIALNYKSKCSQKRCFLTHDIDFLGMFNSGRFYHSLIGDIVKRRDFVIAINKLKKRVKNEDPHSVERLIKLNSKYKAKGTYFFMPSIQPIDTYGGYDVVKNAQKLRKLKSAVLNNNGSVGIHYDSRHLDIERMDSDIEMLSETMKCSILSGRAHYLIFNITKSFDIYEKNGLKLDSTGGFADQVGFRFGTSHPFKPYNFNENRAYNIIEIPLIAMDVTLQGEQYMQLSPEESFEKIKKMIDKVNRYKGVFTVLWHNTSFYSNGWEDWISVYEKMLKYICDGDGVFLSADELIQNEMN